MLRFLFHGLISNAVLRQEIYKRKKLPKKTVSQGYILSQHLKIVIRMLVFENANIGCAVLHTIIGKSQPLNSVDVISE